MYMKKIKQLGIFDSGLGGYTVYQDLKVHFPELSMVLFADQKYAPYGNYDNETIIKLATRSMNWFLSQEITDVLLACNTVTSVALETLQERFPTMRIWGIVDLTLSQLPKTPIEVGVVATQATVSAHAYKKEFEKNYQGNIREIAMKDLAFAIESLEDDATIDKMIQDAMQKLKDVSHIILGCTHYPLVKDQFEKASDAIFLDSMLPIREFVGENYEKTSGEKRVVTTKDDAILKNQIKILFKEEEEVEKVCASL